jgi:hypothetical protein
VFRRRETPACSAGTSAHGDRSAVRRSSSDQWRSTSQRSCWPQLPRELARNTCGLADQMKMLTVLFVPAPDPVLET